MYPHERSLVKRLQNKSFALLGINSDSDRDKLKEILKTSGPIASKWNVTGWPTIYVLDAKGVIRYLDLRGKELDEAVEKLLQEVAQK
jgi:hypothetical protein